MWAVQVGAFVVGLLLTMVQDSGQLRWSDPLRGVLDRINQNAAAPSYIGLVMAFPTEEVALLNSGYFVSSSDIPWVDLAGTWFPSLPLPSLSYKKETFTKRGD
ncbi:hypothetical protein TorRG33x02_279100 [Trema orientale]|uniref:Uncharacterized protein n=1 Tax=Trema orientale TaxID=63057 RepID=A0A2P5CN07_TREOI|nr:hypothetical protein TorRG33x02_279100 [Trema orientale]